MDDFKLCKWQGGNVLDKLFNLLGGEDDTTAIIAITILSFPSEIIYEILGHLDWRSILAIKLTCTLLFETTKCRAFWLNFIQRIQKLPYVARTEEPLEAYTTEELEKWALTRMRVEDAWDVQAVAPLQITKTKAATPFHAQESKILPGGRWCLLLFQKEIWYLDLDSRSADCQLQFLIGVPKGYNNPSTVDDHIEFVLAAWAVWVDYTKPTLAFRLVFSGCCIAGNWASKGWIFEVKLLGHGADATLTANPTPIATIIVPGESSRPCYILDGEYCISARYTSAMIHGSQNLWLSIYPYENRGECIDPHIIPLMIDRSKFVEQFAVVAVPANRILVMCNDSVYLYDYSRAIVDLKACHGAVFDPNSQAHIQIQRPTYRLSLSLQYQVTYHPVYTGTMTRVVFQADSNIIGLSIPNNSHSIPQSIATTTFGSIDYIDDPHQRYTGWSTGYSHSIILRNKGLIELIEHSDWNDDPNGAFQSRWLEYGLTEDISSGQVCNMNYQMNEEQGRIVAILSNNDIAVVNLTSLLPGQPF